MEPHESIARDAAPIRIAICGGGAGAVLALQALRQQARRVVDVTILEPRPVLGVGVAYSTPSPVHLLNTRACNMSVTENPDDFVRWLRTERPRRILNWTRDDFAPRAYFGEYLQARVHEASAASHVNVRWLRDPVDAVKRTGDCWEIIPGHGDAIPADAVILATGNERPRPIARDLPPAARSLVIEDPWDVEQKAAIPQDAPVLLAGTGLTAVDIALELIHRGHKAPITAISRHGLLPRPHGPLAPAREGLLNALPSSVRALVRHLREVTANDPGGEKWRRVFTDLRGITPSLWRGLSVTERRRFLRHLRTIWDVHRHRIPPLIHSRLQRAIAARRLTIVRGRIVAIEPADSRSLRVVTASRGASRVFHVARVVNCTGPELNPANSSNPLLQGLVLDGVARLDALGLGLAVDAESRVIGANGSAHATLFALGALTRGTRWEISAIPEMRDQANAVARQLLQTFERGRARASAAASRADGSLRMSA